MDQSIKNIIHEYTNISINEERSPKLNSQRKMPNRLEFNDSVSPNKLSKLFHTFLINHILIKKKLKMNSLERLFFENENTRFNTCINDSIAFSFRFNKTKFNKYKHYLNETQESIYQYKTRASFFGENFSVIDFINNEELNEFRNLFLYLQNKNKFKNFSENRLAEILHYNFQTINNNSGNSIANNRKFIEVHRKRKENNHSLYYIEFKHLKIAELKRYI